MKKASDGAEEPDPGSTGEKNPVEPPGSKEKNPVEPPGSTEENDPKPTSATNSDEVLPEADAALCPDPGHEAGEQGISAVAVLWTFGKCLSALLPVYLCGYYRVSTGLLVCGMMVYTGWKHAREAKDHRWRSAVHLAEGEEHTLSRNKKDLPAWVNFPDVEKVEWLNKVLQQVWPFVGQYLEKLLVETIAPSIRGSSSHLQTLTFTKVDFGDKPMKVVGIKAHTENDKGQVLLDVYISYVGNVEIDVEVKRYFCKAGVKGIQLHGMMRVILEPLIGDVPIVGAVTMFFIRRPKLDINWTGLTNLLDIPGLSIMSDGVIMDAIASFLVLPNRLTVPLVPDLHVAQLRFPLPRGVVRIHLVEASDLPSKDNYVRGMLGGMSDPYALLRVGPQTFTSKTIDNTLSPTWGEIYEVVVHEVPGQELEVEVYDKDSDQDDFLGRTKMDLGIVRKSIVVDDWFTLKDTKSGRVHLRLEWLKLLADTDRLDEVLQKNSSVTSSKSADPPSAAILVVYLDKAESLPMKKGNKEPNPMVQLSVQDITKESKTCWTAVDPTWEEAFTFFIQDPRKQDIDIQVKDSDRVQTLGSLTIPMSRLLSSSALTLDQWFQLDQAGPASRIYIKAVLRVLWLDEEKMSAVVASHLEADRMSKQLPQNTHPHPSFSTEGLLRIHLLEGQQLVPKDNLMGGLVKGKSDPYVNINIGGETFTSHVIKSNLNPVWNEMYEVVLTDLPGQDLQMEILDKDMDMKDDFMGRLKINLKDIISSQYTDQWYNVCDVKSGRVHLVLEWVPKSTEAEGLDQVLRFLSRQSYHNKTVPSAGLLFVYVERADSLPLKPSGKEPKVGAELILRKTSHKTTVCDRTTSPQWNEAFYFLVRDPREDMLIIKLSHSWALPIGSVVVPLRDLLSEPQLVLDQWLNLDGASPDSQILLRAELKMLIPTKCPVSVTVKSSPPSAAPEPQTDLKQRSSSVDTPAVEAILEPEVGEVQAEVEEVHVEELQEPAVLQKEVLQPPHTSPDVSFGSEGFLRLHLLEAQSLVAKDNRMGMKGKSDPYVKVNVGATTFSSHVIKENLNPVWNEMHEVVLRPQLGLVVKVELYDKDMDSDDFLGRVNISLADIIQSQYTDQWFTLSDVKSGQIHLVLEWVPSVSTTDNLDQVLQLQTVHSFQNKAVPTAALLQVFLERAHCLPLKKSGKEPKAGAELVFGDTTYRTKVCERTKSPQWNEAFHFLVRDPRQEMLIVKLSSAWDQPLGSLVLPVRELLSEPQLVLDQWFHLDGASPDSQILLRAELKILQTRMIEALEAQPSEDEVTTTVVSADHQSEDEVTTTTTEVDEVTTAERSAPSSRELEVPADRGTEVVETSSRPEPDDEGDVDEEPPVYQPHPRPDGGATVTPPPPRETSPTCTPPEETPPAESQEELQPPTQGPHIGHDLAQSTVPFDLPPEKSPEQTLPPHTTPGLNFATEGVLRIHLLEGRSLVAKDNWGMVKGKSDPYVKVSVGDLMTFKSRVIEKNLNPVWSEMYELVVSGQTAQEIRFEVYDKDLDSDDFLGRFSIRLDDIIRPKYTDQWYTLKDVKSGQVHVVVEWVPAVSQKHRLDQVLQLQQLQSFQNRTVPSAALLFVQVDQAHALPLKKSGKEPKAGAELVLGGTTHRTKMCDRSVDPQWKQAFYFLVRDPKHEMLILKLSSGWDQPLGSLVLPVRELLSEPQLVLDQWFHLDGASPDSQILLRAELKILDSKMVELIGTNSLPCAASGGP